MLYIVQYCTMYNIVICCTMYNVHCTYYNYTYYNFVTAFILFPINKLKTDNVINIKLIRLGYSSLV